MTVSAESPLIDVTSKEIGGNISNKALADIPTISRNFTYFAGLLPGVVPTANLASWGSDTLTANGVDSRNNSYLVDGAWDNDDYLGQNNGAQARVPLEAAQEFQVLVGQFDAEFGRTSGAIVNAVIKSGTNQFHGSGFEYFTNRNLRAADFFQAQNNLAKPDTTKEEFGFSTGGPIVKDKIHEAQPAVPGGAMFRNTGEVYLDTTNRVQPYVQEISAGYQQQLGSHVSASADYVHTMARDLWELINLNPGLR